jgi:hypothetical protein
LERVFCLLVLSLFSNNQPQKVDARRRPGSRVLLEESHFIFLLKKSENMKKSLLLALWLWPCFTLQLVAQNWEIETIRDNIVGAWSRTADFDLDGDPDILVQAGDSILWYENLRPGWTGHLIDPTFINSIYGYVDVVDVDGDGDMDVIKVPSTLGDGTEELTWNENIENGTSWEKHLIVTITATASWFQNAYGDLDGDGDLDISVAEYDFVNSPPLGSLYWLEQTPGEWVKHPLRSGNHWLSSIADMDGDGDLDITASWDSIFWLENKLPLEDWTVHFVASSIGAGSVGTCADMTGDGQADIVSSPAESNGGLAIFINPSWEEVTIKPEFGLYPGVPGDIDSDGDLDLPYGGVGFGFVLPFGWAENQDDGTAWVLHDVMSPSPFQIIPTGVADIDGDGDMDLVALTFNTDTGLGSAFWAVNPMVTSGTIATGNLPLEVQISPNPVSNFLTVHLPQTESRTFSVQLSDLNGRLLLKCEIQGSAPHVLDLKDFSRGSYLLKVFDEKNVATTRLVKF